tara:strand:- start:368 stop:568 length:201 start_codon:yes stop_codon:yes gene_type:complete
MSDIADMQIEFECDVMSLITILNQNGLNYEGITNLIQTSVTNCINKYDKNRDLLTIVFKKLSNEAK